MDIIVDILPILFFIVVSIFKATKNKAGTKKSKKHKRKQGKQTIQRRRVEHFPPRQEPMPMENTVNKETTMISESASSSVEKPMQAVSEIEVEDLSQNSEIDMKNKDITKSKYTIGSGIEEGIGDRIAANEIGKSAMMLDKKSIRKAIIMAEVLGKPKALKNKKL
ncbi:hypothetical protein QBE52_08045 [Clostridiaceae bacterium 35-E11]